jgi:hypothetical protein
MSASVGVMTDARTLTDASTMTDMKFPLPATAHDTNSAPASPHPATPQRFPSILSDLSDIELDLAADLIGRQVPQESGTVQWRDGHTTILPCVLKDGVNICEANDVRFVEYLAKLPQSTADSKRVVHIESDSVDGNQLRKLIASALSMGKPVVVRGATRPPVDKELTVEFLEKFGISRNMAVTVHGVVPLFAVKLVTNSIGTRCRSTCKRLPVSAQVRDHRTIHS